MSERITLVVGAALFLSALFRVWLHVQANTVLAIPTCLGGTVELPIGAPAVDSVHCWGCYAAPIGLALMLAAPMRRALQPGR